MYGCWVYIKMDKGNGTLNVKLIFKNVDLKNYSWFNLGGPAKNFLKPKNNSDLIKFFIDKNDMNKNISYFRSRIKYFLEMVVMMEQ